MKKLSAILACTLLLSTAFSQTKISIDSVSKHIGEKVTVCGEVYGVKSFDKTTYINVGASYPNSPLTIVIFKTDVDKNFKEAPEKLYANQQICVTGVVKEYKGKAEIIVSHPRKIIIEGKPWFYSGTISSYPSQNFSIMNSFFKTIIAGYGAKKLGGGCFSTILIFFVIYWALGNCGKQQQPVKQGQDMHAPASTAPVVAAARL